MSRNLFGEMVMPRIRNYFAPCVSVNLDFDSSTVDFQDFRVHQRKWQVSTFDLATLATKHRLHLPYQLMDVFLNGPTNMEIEIVGATSHDEAIERLNFFKATLYLGGVGPFIVPFICTHSINEYAGINSRDSDLLREKLPPALRDGITSSGTTIEAWPNEPSFQIFSLRTPKSITEEISGIAACQARKIRAIEDKRPELSAVRYALVTAPQITHVASSFLHLWTGLESLLPNVRTEVSFRISLLLAELSSPIRLASEVYGIAKRSYVYRSNAAHGNFKKIGYEEWYEAWDLLCTCLRAVIHRGDLPSEETLLNSMLSRTESNT
jgi:hypothetical protein